MDHNSNVEIIYCTAEGKRICVEVTNPVKELLEQSDCQNGGHYPQSSHKLHRAGA